MNKMRVVTAGVALAGVLLVAGIAEASSQVSGEGLTKRGATLGMVARVDHNGHLTYIRHDTSFTVMCSHFHSFHSSKTSKGYRKIVLTAKQCFRSDGAQRYLKATFIDRGDPGIGLDVARMRWAKSWPVNAANTVRRDRGRITAGNLQVL